jgi:hypothetical protein
VSEKGDRPIPVRSVAPPPASTPAVGDSEPERAGPHPAPLEPSRSLEIAGRQWEVRAVGRTRTGHGRDAGALLLLLAFTPAGAGEGQGADEAEVEVGDATPAGVREALAVARSLDDLDDDVLAELLERSRPVPRQGSGAPGS